MAGPFDNQNPYSRDDRSNAITRSTYYLTRRQRQKLEDQMLRDQANRVRQQIMTKPQFTPMDFNKFDTPSLPTGAQADIIVAQANANNPNPIAREKDANWFMKAMQKWDDWTVSASASGLNPITGIAKAVNPRFGRELARKKKRYEREYLKSGKTQKEANTLSSRAAWRETDYAKGSIFGWEVDPLKFGIELASDPTNFVFWGAGAGVKVGVKTAAKAGRKALAKAPYPKFVKGIGITREETITMPRQYWLKQTKNTVKQTVFKGQDQKRQKQLTDKFFDWLEKGEEGLDERTISQFLSDNEVAKSFKTGAKEAYRAPLFKTSKKYLQSGKSDFAKLRRMNDPNSISDLKAAGQWVGATESKILAPLRWIWGWADASIVQNQSKSGRALLLHGISEVENKSLVAHAVRQYSSRFTELGINSKRIDEGDIFRDFIKPRSLKTKFGKNATKAREQLKDWHTFLENAFDDAGNAASWLKANKKQQGSLKEIINAWGEHAYHLVENGILKPEDIGLKTILKKGSLSYELDTLKAGRRYIGRVVDSIQDRQMHRGRVAFTKIGAEKKRIFRTPDLNDIDKNFKSLLDDDWSIKTLDDAAEMKVSYLNPVASFDIKSGEILQRINDTKLTNRLKGIGLKSYNASSEIAELRMKRAGLKNTVDNFKKHITKLTPKSVIRGAPYADDLQRLIQKTVADPQLNEILPSLDKMDEALNGPIKQRARNLENARKMASNLDIDYREQLDIAESLRNSLKIAKRPSLSAWKKDVKSFTRSQDFSFFEPVLVPFEGKFLQQNPGYSKKIKEILYRKTDTNIHLFEDSKYKSLISPKSGKIEGKFKFPETITDLRKLIGNRTVTTEGVVTYDGLLSSFGKELEDLANKNLLTGGALEDLNTIKNQIANANDGFHKLIKKYDRDYLIKKRVTVGENKLNEIIGRIDGLKKSRGGVGVFNRTTNREFYDRLARYQESYTKTSTDSGLRATLRSDLEESLEKIINNANNTINSNDQLIRTLGLLQNDSKTSRKLLKNIRNKDGAFYKVEFDALMDKYPKPLRRLLREYQEDPTFANNVTEGINSINKEFDQIVKNLDNQSEALEKSIINYKETLEGKGRLVDPNVKLGKNEQAKKFFGTDLKRHEQLENISIKNGIYTKELENYFFDPATKKGVEAFLGTGAKKFEALESLGKMGDVLRVFKTAFDLGAPVIQGLPLFFTSPARWARATGNHYKVFFQGKESIASFYAQKRDVIQRMIDSGANVSGEGLDYYAALRKGEWIPKTFSRFDEATAKTGIYGATAKERAQEGLEVGFGIGKAAERFNDAFDTFGDMARIELFEALEKTALKKAAVAGTDKELAMQQLSDLVNKMTGAFDSRALGANRQSIALERAFMFFSPRYTRASMSVITDVLLGGKNGIQGEMARDTLLKMLSAGTTIYAGTVTAMNIQEAARGVPESERSQLYLDPRPTSEGGDGGKFMKLKVGDNFVGPGSFWLSALKLTGNILGDPAFRGDKADSPLLLQSEEPRGTTANLLRNPIVSWLRGRTSPISGLAWDLQQGHDFIGEPLETPVDISKHIGSQLAPFWFETGFLQGSVNPLGAISEFGGMNARETTDWEVLQELQDQEAQRVHGVNWEDLSVLQKEEIEIANAGTADDIAAEQERIFSERKKSPFGTLAQEVLPDWYDEIDLIKGTWDEQLTALDIAVQDNQIDLPQYINLIKDANHQKRMAFRRLKENSLYQPIYENLEYRKLEDIDNVGDFFYDEYMRIITDDTTHSLLPNELVDLGLGSSDSEFVDWDARNAEVAEFEERVGPEVMEYIDSRFDIPKIGEGSHPLYLEYLAGRKKYLDTYYRQVEEQTLDFHGEQSKEAYKEWKNATSFQIRADIEKQSPYIKILLRDMRKAREILRQTDPELDAFLYRFGIGKTNTLKHPYNRFDFRKGELGMPFPMQTYLPTFTED